MEIFDVFDAVIDGTFKDFKKFYTGDINQIDKALDLNLLGAAVTNDKLPTEKIKIIKFLLHKGIDLTYATKNEHRNALHLFYFCVWRPTVEYENQVTNLLIEYGIDVNQIDKYNAIPMKYAITLNKLTTAENAEMYRTLLTAGADYNWKDTFGNSVIDCAKKHSWRTDFLDIVKEFEQSKQ